MDLILIGQNHSLCEYGNSFFQKLTTKGLESAMGQERTVHDH